MEIRTSVKIKSLVDREAATAAERPCGLPLAYQARMKRSIDQSARDQWLRLQRLSASDRS